MKKILYSAFAAALLMAACSDQNDVVNDLVDTTKDRAVVKSIPYTLTDADYKSISDAAVKAAGDNAANKALAQAVNVDKALNSYATAAKFFPELLAKKYLALDVTSAIQVTYGYREDYLGTLSNRAVTNFTAEDFEVGYAAGAKWTNNGWKSFVTKGDGSKFWKAASFSNNTYMQMTANGGTKEVSEVYAVSPAMAIPAAGGVSFSFDMCVAYYNAPVLKVLVSTDAKAATAPADAAWDDVSANFTMPTTPTSGYGVLAPAGTMAMDAYNGKTVYVAFMYNGETGMGNPNRTTTVQVDNVWVSSGDRTAGSTVYELADGKWAATKRSAIAVTADDLAAMGFKKLAAADAAKYLPAFLAQKFPYAQEKDKKAVVYPTSTLYARADEYYFSGGKWTPSVAAGGRRTEQYVLSEKGWVFDPTIVYNFDTTADYQMVVDAVLADPATSMFVGLDSEGKPRTNEEWYYGFSANFRNVSFRLSYRGPDTSSFKYDTELQALATDAEKVALLWKRLETKGLPLLLSLKYPNTPAEVDGVAQMYKVNALMYGYDGVSADPAGKMYQFTYRVTKAGPKPEFEHVETVAM